MVRSYMYMDIRMHITHHHTTIYVQNTYAVYADGAICLDILQNQWSPIYDVAAILTSIQSLLSDPNPNSPANSEAAKLFVEDRREYNRRVKVVVQLSWKDDGQGESGGSEDDDSDDDDVHGVEEGRDGAVRRAKDQGGVAIK